MVLTTRRLLVIRLSVEESLKKHAVNHDQLVEISHWEALSRIKSVLEWPMGATLKLESEKVVAAGSTLKFFTKLLDRLRGIGRGQEEGYESRTVMVLANGCTTNSVKNWKMMEYFSSTTFSWLI